MSEIAENKDIVDEELKKVGKTMGKLLLGVLSFLEKVGVSLSPIMEGLLVNALAKVAEAFVLRTLKKNGIEV